MKLCRGYSNYERGKAGAFSISADFSNNLNSINRKKLTCQNQQKAKNLSEVFQSAPPGHGTCPGNVVDTLVAFHWRS